MATALTPRDLLALGGAALAIVALLAGGWLALSGTSMVGGAASSPGIPALLVPSSGDPSPTAEPNARTDLLVDVQGAVARPGVVRLAPGARIADAIAAAGGYTPLTDLLAAATSINLAAPLADGAQVFVPIVGVAAAGPATGGGGGGTVAGSLVNLNTASPEELEALPNIGPVTVQKIIAARQERPFATLEELVTREVMNNGQLDDIRELVTL